VASVLTQGAGSHQSLAAVCGSSQQVAGAAISQSASAKSGSVQQNCTRRRRQRRRGAEASASSDSASAGAASGRPIVPFYGFSDEYALAHIHTTNKDIRRIKIIISLLKSGSLSERQVNNILPLRKPCQLDWLPSSI